MSCGVQTVILAKMFLGKLSWDSLPVLKCYYLTCRHLNSTFFFIQKWFISIENTPGNKIDANASIFWPCELEFRPQLFSLESKEL